MLSVSSALSVVVRSLCMARGPADTSTVQHASSTLSRRARATKRCSLCDAASASSPKRIYCDGCHPVSEPHSVGRRLNSAFQQHSAYIASIRIVLSSLGLLARTAHTLYVSAARPLFALDARTKDTLERCVEKTKRYNFSKRSLRTMAGADAQVATHLSS